MSVALHATSTFNVRASFNKWLKDALANITLPYGVTYTFVETWPETALPTPCISVIHADIARDPEYLGRYVGDSKGVSASGLVDISVWVSRRDVNWLAQMSLLKSAVEAVCAGNSAIAVKNYLRAAATPETTPYIDNVLALDNTNLIKYHVLNETSGTSANDLSSTNSDATYSAGVTLNGATGDDGQPAAGFDGNDYVNIYSTAFNSAYNGTQLTVAGWFRAANTGVWSDGNTRVLFNLAVDGSNYAQLYKLDSTGALVFGYSAGGTARAISNTSITSASWFHIALTVSTDGSNNFTMRAYINGSQVGSTQTGTGTYAGSLASTAALIGANDTTGSSGWSGYAGHFTLWDTAFTDAKIATLATIPTPAYNIRFQNLDMGDTVADTGNPDIMRSRHLLRYEWTLRTNV